MSFRKFKQNMSIFVYIAMRILANIAIEGNRMGSIKIHNGGKYAHAQDSKMLITSARVKIQLNL